MIYRRIDAHQFCTTGLNFLGTYTILKRCTAASVGSRARTQE